MMSTAQLAELSAERDAIEEDRGAVAYALRREANALAVSGTLHLEAVASACEQFRNRMLDLDRRLQVLAAEAGFRSRLDSGLSLASLGGRIEELRANLPVRKLLAEAARLQGELSDTDWRAVRKVVAELDSAADDAVQNRLDADFVDQHPLAALLRLVRQPALLSDSEWDRDHADVKAAFGSGVASAAARGRLLLAAADSPLETRSE